MHQRELHRPECINGKPNRASVNPDLPNAMLRNICWFGFKTSAEVPQVAPFLASSASDYITGEVRFSW